MRVLLVEDEPEMAAALAAALKNYDMVVDHISTLADAEEAVAVNAYAAILFDRRLPDGDGLTLIPKLRTGGVGVPVIVLSARDTYSSEDRALKAGATAFLQKPADSDELLNLIRASLGPGNIPRAICLS